MIRKSNFVGQFREDIFKRYNFIQELGNGTYGYVYRIKDKLNGQIFACKRINKNQIKRKDRLTIEIDLLKSSDHQNIVKLFEIYEDEIFIYLVMEECRGGELFNVLSKRTKNSNMYTEREAALIFKQIMSAILYCHKNGVCHRDLKPENILFENWQQDSYVKLIDFGLSKLFTPSNNKMSSIVGTVYYMAPEVINGTYNEKCDIWSAGIILFVLLSGVPPFLGRTLNGITQKILDIKYDFNRPEWSNVSNESKDLLQKIFVCADKRPTAEEILNHVWVNKLSPNSKEIILNLDFKNVFEYSNMNKIQKSIISFVTYRFTFEQTRNLTEIFKSLDVNSDGVLTISELGEGLNIIYDRSGIKINENDLNSIFENIDLDKSGNINYSEFLAATLDLKKEIKIEHMFEAFKSFDSDNNGTISLKEISDIIKPNCEEDVEYLKDLIKSIDVNGDGEIDFDEFLKILGISVNNSLYK